MMFYALHSYFYVEKVRDMILHSRLPVQRMDVSVRMCEATSAKFSISPIVGNGPKSTRMLHVVGLVEKK